MFSQNNDADFLEQWFVDLRVIRCNLFAASSLNENKQKIIEKCKCSQNRNYMERDQENETLKNLLSLSNINQSGPAVADKEYLNFNIEKVVQVILGDDSPGHMYFIYNHDDTKNELFHHLKMHKRDGQKLPVDSVKNYVCQIIFGLKYLHSNDIIHSYLNTRDIYIYQNGTIKIAGFYYVEKLPTAESESRMDRKLPYRCSTQEQTHITLKYDIWCLGWILHEMCTFEKKPTALENCQEDFTDFERPELPEYFKKLSKSFKNFTVVNPIQRKSLTHLLENDDALKEEYMRHDEKIKEMALIGQILNDKYRIVAYIGKGSYSVVFKGANEENRKIVIKKIDSNRKDANRETNLKILTHDHIAKYYDFFDYNGNPFVVTEYCNFMSLDSYIQDQKMKKTEIQNKTVLVWSIQLFNALTYIHSFNVESRIKVVHRDIKPSNIMLHKDSKSKTVIVKLIDFGESELLEGISTMSSLHGTHYYIAPEVLNLKYDKKADVWSGGCVIYEMIELKKPFNDEYNNITKIYEKIKNVSLNISNVNFLKCILKKIFVLEPKERYDSATVLKELCQKLNNNDY